MLFSICIGLVLSGSLCYASESDNVVLKKLLDLESRLIEQELRLVNQENKIAEQGLVNANQQLTIKQQQQTIYRLEMENIKQQEAIGKLETKLTDLEDSRSENCNKKIVTNSSKHQQHTRNSRLSLSVRQQNERVAFTAYLDHTLEHLGINHPVVYNKVLLNEGAAYHNTTGIFICPFDGLYGFYFSISTYGISQDLSKLVVEGVNQVDAVSDTFHVGHNAQGANFAVLSLTKGQQVWVANYHNSEQSVVSLEDYRYATFSGFSLY